MPKILLKAAVSETLPSFFLVTFVFAQNNGLPSASQEINSHPLSTQDKQFLDNLAKDSQGEVEVAQYVESKTNNPKVKEFAQRMIHDHTILDAEVKEVMDKHSMSMPQPMTAEQQQLLSKLKNESGKQLDQTFMEAQVKGHEEDLSKITPEAEHEARLQPIDPTVGEVAQEARPVIAEHLRLAKEVARDVGVNSATAGGK